MKRSFAPLKILALGLLICLIAACSPSSQTFYTRVSDAKLKAGDAIPAPTGPVIVTVTGKIGTTNQDKAIVMDRATIESVGQVEYKVTDPFENKPFVYRGVLVSDLLGLWKVADDAKSLKFTALDDYQINVSLTEIRKYPVLFALQRDGQDLPATRAPAMLVYPYDNFTFDQKIYNNYWAWQIKTIEVQ